MSLACLECNRVGMFNTLIIFEPEGSFDAGGYISSYRNFYTCCASLTDFTEGKKSRFMVVQDAESQDAWNTGTDGARLRDTKHKRVDEATVRRKLPRIFEELAQKPSCQKVKP